MTDTEEIFDGLARALWVDAWARWAEERGQSLRGDLMDLAPETSVDADAAAAEVVNKDSTIE